MAGVKKAVKSPPSFAAFGNELEAAAAVSGYSTVSPPNCILLTAHLSTFLKDHFLWKHVREGEKEEKMKALGSSEGGQLLLKHVSWVEKEEKMNGSR